MKLKSKSLHFEINPSRNNPIGYIRNSYREDGKIKHQTISKIHGLTLEQLQNMKNAFDGKVIACSDITLTDGKEYGASSLLYELSKKIGLSKILYSRNEPWVHGALAMIIGRIVYQGSKLSLSRVPEISYLWEICGVTDKEIDVDKRCYDVMDELISRQELIQKKLADKHLSDGSVILYDITSSYFEGDYDDTEIVTYGYNRDKKRGKKQITIGLICNKYGCPVAVNIFPGNTTDCTSVQPIINEIKGKYGISNFVFVGDRGMLTQKNLKINSDISTITALTHAAMKKLCNENNVEMSLFDEDIGTEVILPEQTTIRYILRKNPFRGEKEQKTRLTLIQKTEDKLNEVALPKKAVDAKTLASRAAKVFYKYKTEKYFYWCIKGGKINFSRKNEIIAEEEKYDGLYVIRSNVSKEILNTIEVVKAYKSLSKVEYAFRNMKTVQLEIRPVYHKTEERIKAHVFICMLSYYLLWHFNTSLAPLYAENPIAYTHTQVIEIMKTLQKSKMSVAGSNIFTYTISQPTHIQKKIRDLILETSA
jgi:transposase